MMIGRRNTCLVHILPKTTDLGRLGMAERKPRWSGSIRDGTRLGTEGTSQGCPPCAPSVKWPG